jgi:uncharacterized protein YggE
MNKGFAGLVAIFMLLNVEATSQEVSKQRTINVSGLAEMEIVPDEIYVRIDLREYDKKGGGKVDIESIKNDFLKAAISIGIKDTDITVQGYQGWDGSFWIYKKNKKKNPDLKAGITYQVKVSTTTKMDELVQKLDDEATQGFFISRVSHSRLQQFKKDLKIEAVKSAKEKAAYLANAINEKAGQAITINEPNELTNFPHPVYPNVMMKSEARMAADAEPLPVIDFKKIKLQFEVNATFALQ